MREAHFRDLPGNSCEVRRPGPKTRSKSVGDRIYEQEASFSHASHVLQQAHIADVLIVLHPEEDVIGLAMPAQGVQNGQGWLCQRDTVLTVGFHATGFYGPYTFVYVDLVPCCADDFTSSRRGEYEKFESKAGYGLRL